MIFFTSITLNYLPKARLLSKTLKKSHPDWHLYVIINDRIESHQRQSFIEENSKYFSKIFWLDNLEINNKEAWIFQHTTVELCTAVKGLFLKELVFEGHEKIVYLDPDIAIFNNLTKITTLLDDYAILLTPHLLDPEEEKQAILDNEIAGTLRHGVFNLGFLAINGKKSDGVRFSNWWYNRLLEFCYSDYELGLFTDQKWCDLIPCFFNDYFIIRDPGYNVASWNINKRNITFSKSGQLVVNKEYPLRFFHFTGYDSGAGKIMTQRYRNNNQIVDELWNWYSRELLSLGQEYWENKKCSYDFYDNGKEISYEDRQIFRKLYDQGVAQENPYRIYD